MRVLGARTGVSDDLFRSERAAAEHEEEEGNRKVANGMELM